MKKKNGNIFYPSLFFFVMYFLLIYLAFAFLLRRSEYTSTMTQNALNVSTLAGTIIDLPTLGLTGDLVVADATASYENFKDALKVNMELDDTYSSVTNTLMVSPVTIDEYIIYNYYTDGIQVIEFNTATGTYTTSGMLNHGSVTTKSGTLVTKTSIYSEIHYEIKTLSQNSTITKWACVDVTDN